MGSKGTPRPGGRSEPSMMVQKSISNSPRGIAQGEMPPPFVLGPKGDAELVNYRARQNYYIVDRLFAAAALRLGADGAKKVRIVRTDGKPAS
jgi:type IV secretion system protein TrbG